MIQLNSKALQSELIILRKNSKILIKSNYIVVSSLKNPYFHWGNFLIFEKAPQKNEIALWEEYFCYEFPELVQQHRAFTWVRGDNIPNFNAVEYSLEKMVCLTTKDVQIVKQSHPGVTIRRIKSDEEWVELVRKQIERLNPDTLDAQFIKFIELRFNDYKSMVDANLGDWFIAILEGDWVGDLGLFYGDGLARYQNVTTYPGFEGRGIAHSLIYASAKFALANYPIEELVIVADENGRAQKIYQNLGFEIIEKRTNLYRSKC